MASFFLPSHTSYLALMFFSSFTTHIMVTGTNFSCPVDSPPSRDTYVAYFAQSPNFLTLTNISDIFDTSPLSIARASNIKDENKELIPGELLLVPVTCGCSGNHSYANISHLIKQAAKFGALPEDIMKTNNLGQNFTAATNFPVLIPVTNLPALSQSYSSHERKRSNHLPVIIAIGTSLLGCTLLISVHYWFMYTVIV